MQFDLPQYSDVQGDLFAIKSWIVGPALSTTLTFVVFLLPMTFDSISVTNFFSLELGV